MGRGKNLAALRQLPDDVLAEVVREGESRLQAQFDAANAADQRAVAWTGLLISLASASIAGAAALYINHSHIIIACVAIMFSLGISIATFNAIACFRPSHFDIPGNVPENWLPEYWENDRPTTLAQGRIEQAIGLNNRIADNAQWAHENGGKLRLSMDIAVWTVVTTSILLIFAILIETYPPH